MSAAFYCPLIFGYCFLPLSYLSVTPLWYDPQVVPNNYDLFDAIIYFLPMDEFLSQQLAQARFPFWSPYNLGGHPVAFNGQTGFFYPPKLLLLALFPSWLAHGILLALHTWLAGYSGYLLSRRFGQQPLCGLFFGVLWQFNGYLMSWLELSQIGVAAAWTPVVILTALRARDSWKHVALFAISLAVLLVSSHLQFMLNFLIFGVVAGCYLAGRWDAGRLWRFFCGLVLGLGLASPYLIPSAILMSLSQRPVMTSEFLLGSYRQFLLLAPPTMVFPDLFGNPASFFCLSRISGSGNFIYAETCLYMGVIPLFFAILGGWSKEGRIFLGATLVTLGLPATPLYPLLAHLPGLNHINSVRFVGLAQLFLVTAAAFGFELWRSSERPGPARAAYRGLLALAALACWKLFTIVGAGWQGALSPGALRMPEPALYLDRDTFFLAVKTGFEHCYRLSNPNFLLPILSLALLGYVLASRPSRSPVLLLVATIVELASFSYRHNPVEPSSLWFPSTPVTTYLSEHLGIERVAGLSTIKPNTLLPFALRDVGGYDSFYPRDSAVFLDGLMNRPHAPGALSAHVLTGSSLSDPLLDLLGVRYLISRPGVVPPGLALAQNEGLPIYRRETTLPRTFLCSEAKVVKESALALETLKSPDFPRSRVALVEAASADLESLDPKAEGQATLVSDNINSVNVRCQSSGKQLLVLTDAWCPGWKVTVNGEPGELHKVDVMFRGVVVGAGESEVIFSFHPPGWTASLYLMGLSVLICLGLGFSGKRS